MSLRLSNKYGVNPSISKCFYCGEDKNELVLLGAMKGDTEAPRAAVFNMEPCEQCKEYMQQGIILVSVDERKSTDLQNPYRTGAFAVVTEEAIRRIVSPTELADKICKRRFSFVPDEAWDMLGLPRDNGQTPTKAPE